MSSLTQVYVHYVWSTKYRNPVISTEYKSLVECVLIEISRKVKIEPLAIYAMPDHVHLLVIQHPTIGISDYIGHLKRQSTKFIKSNSVLQLQWQKGYGAFGVALGAIPQVKKYIFNQVDHHQTTKFEGELIKMLDDHRMEYNKDYLFE